MSKPKHVGKRPAAPAKPKAAEPSEPAPVLGRPRPKTPAAKVASAQKSIRGATHAFTTMDEEAFRTPTPAQPKTTDIVALMRSGKANLC